MIRHNSFSQYESRPYACQTNPHPRWSARREGELIKPGEIVAVEGVEGWTLAERRIWNLLLVNAWSDRLEDPAAEFDHSSRMSCAAITTATIGSAPSLRKLQTTLVSVPSPKRQDAHSPDARWCRPRRMTTGRRAQLAYEFSKKLVPLLRDSEIYARMESQGAFRLHQRSTALQPL